LSFFKKILGIAETPREKIPRAPRIRLQNIHHLILTSPRWDAQVIRVVNISTTGLGVEDVDRPEDIVTGSTFPALLTLKQKTYPVILKVAQISQGIVGCPYEGERQQLEQAIFDYFVAEILGMEVSEVNSKLLKADTRGEARWFFGSNNSEIYYIINSGQITYFHLTLLGNYIEYYMDQPPKFGFVVTQEGKNKLKPDQSPIIRFTEDFPPSTLELFIKFVGHVSGLGEGPKALLLNVLEDIQVDLHGKNMQA